MVNTAKGAGPLEITLPSDREIRVTRVFNAPRRLVFDAMTKPELLTRWLGRLPGWTFPVCEVDLRVGGAYRYVWRGPNGEEMGMGGVFREVVAPERVVTAEKFDQAWYAGECVGTMVLVEKAGRTTMTMDLRYDSKEVRDGVLKSPMSTGMEMGYSKLDEVLSSIDSN